MATFGTFMDILPDPNHKIGTAGQADASGVAGPGFAAVKLSSVEPVMSAITNSQRIQKDFGMYHRWEIDIEYNPLTCAEFHPVYTFLMWKRLTLLPFFVSLPQYFNQGISNKTFALAGSMGDTVITINGTGVVPGVMFKESGNPYRQRVYRVTRVETESEYFTPWGSPGAGKERLHITPGLRWDVDPADPITFSDPTFRVIQEGDTNEYALNNNGLFSYSLKLVEVGD